MIRFVVDSTACLLENFLAENENVHVIPLSVTFGTENVSEINIKMQDIFDYVEREDKHPRTSQPSVGEFMEIFNSLPIEDEIIVITVSEGISGTVQGARVAAIQCKDRKIHVINSNTAAQGMENLVRYGLKGIEVGKSYEDICQELDEYAKNMQTFIVPGTLEYLKRGGRLGKASGLLASILKIVPILYLIDGAVYPYKKVRTKKKAVAEMIEAVLEFKNIESIGVIHIGAEEEAYEARDILKERLPDLNIEVTTGSAVLATHLGPGLLAIIFMQKLS